MFLANYPRNSWDATLEANRRAHGHSQIVVGSVVQVNLIARFRANSNGAEEAFKSAAGIEREVGSGISYTRDCAGEGRS